MKRLVLVCGGVVLFLAAAVSIVTALLHLARDPSTVLQILAILLLVRHSATSKYFTRAGSRVSPMSI
jgi:hypothetical protein